ncbi:Imm63 family immunity protein [Aeromonas hydrophila]|uniref:Imm63 family immunity protein n=1 Tax=Aeromonas hydrophila TaxID=644 RepID=UPI002B49DA22|nr:Imm63 family immunity protein [Aeromonas hydrophila]
MLCSFKDIQIKVDNLALQAGFPPKSISIYSAPMDDGTPYVSFEGDRYNYVFSEKGYEFLRKITMSLDELLYWIFSDFVFKKAFEYELDNRLLGRDCRRIAFEKYVEYMGRISPEWQMKSRCEVQQILAESPYDDK